MKKLTLILISFICCGIHSYSQDLLPINPESEYQKEYLGEGFNLDKVEVIATGLVSNDESLPFWMYRNTNGRVSEDSNFMGLARVSASYHLSEKSYFEAGAGVVATNDSDESIHRDELYLSFVNSWLQVTLGSKTPYAKYQGLSTVAQDFLLSGNSRAMPGLVIEASEPLKLSNTIEIDWGIGHYSLNDDRFVKDTRVHYKRLGLIINLDQKSSFNLGLEHYAQWAGTSPQYGELPGSFKDYIDVFFARRAGDDAVEGEILNSLGNHLGFYNVEYNFRPATGVFSFYHQHPFEDGSGTALKNFPDGIWGFYFGPNTRDYDSFITGFSLEYIQTTDQSDSANIGSSRDNYFSNSIYGSWTYHQDVIGLPFITTLEGTAAIQYNRTRGFNFGIAAKHKNWSYKLKTSLVENLGSFVDPIDPIEKAIYSYFLTTCNLESIGGRISFGVGYDYSDKFNDKYGGSLSYTHTF